MHKFIPLVLLIVVVTAKDDLGMKYVMRIYDDCQRADGIIPCLKKKAILFFDRAARMEAIPVVDGVDIVKTSDVEVVPVSENDIEASLPRNLDRKDEVLSEMLWDRIAAFANSRTVQLSMPTMSGDELKKSFEEGRGKKMKKMMGMMMMGAAGKMAALIPLAIAGLFVLAGKALIVSKIALLLAGIIALKKIIAQKNGGGGGGGMSGGGHESHGWSSGGGGGGGSSGGWDKRSYGNDLAYKAYKDNQ